MLPFFAPFDCTSKLDLNGGRRTVNVSLVVLRIRAFFSAFRQLLQHFFSLVLALPSSEYNKNAFHSVFMVNFYFHDTTGLCAACECLINMIIAYEMVANAARKKSFQKITVLERALMLTSTYNPIYWMNKRDLRDSMLAF